MFYFTDQHVLVRLGVAAASGAIVGVQFELRGRPGGLRTHVLTSLAAAMFCMTGVSVASAADTLRVMQGVASGVGFIGAATVLRGADRKVSGIANAASLWITAAVGCEAGLGSVRIALGVSVFVALLNGASLLVEGLVQKRIANSSGETPST
jgi:putative Mg2+ transporter-C (MgtC) family protein